MSGASNELTFVSYPTVDADWGAHVAPDRSDVRFGRPQDCSRATKPSSSDCGESRHSLDIYYPVSGGSKGTIVVFHGGGFFSGDKTELAGIGPLKKQLTNGYAIVAVDYSLSDGDRRTNVFPALARDVVAAMQWVDRRGADHDLNTSKVIAAGISAGGTLAGWAGTTANSNHRFFAGMPSIDGWISVSGILDWDAGPNSQAWGDILHGDAFRRAHLASSPATHIDAEDPPGYLIHGDQDPIVEVDNIDMITTAGADADLTIDIVDTDRLGRPLEHRNHTPLGSADAEALTTWLDAL